MTIQELYEKCRRALESLGTSLDASNLRDKEELADQTAMEAALREFFCQELGHDIGSDICGKPEHDYCHRCQSSASTIRYEREAGWKDKPPQERTWVKISSEGS